MAFSACSRAGFPAVAPGGRVPRAMGLSVLVVGAVVAGQPGVQDLQAGDRDDEMVVLYRAAIFATVESCLQARVSAGRPS